MYLLLRSACLSAAASMAAFPVCAQSLEAENTASELYLDVSVGLNFYDNYESLANPVGTTSLIGTDFALGYESETRSQKLSFKTGARLEVGEFAEDPDRSSQLINPFATLRYRREAETSFFRTDLSYREHDNGIDVQREFESSTDLIVDQGTRSDARGDFEIAVGLGTPIWATADLNFHRRRFFDTTDPDLTDQDRVQFDGEVGLEITRTATFLLTALYQDRDDIENIRTDETRSRIGVGLLADIGPDLTFRGVAQYERTETTSSAGSGRIKSVEEGPTIDLSLIKERPNGNLRFSLGSEIDSNGLRTTARVGRALELPRGLMDFTLGLTQQEDGDFTPVGSLKWQRDYRTRAVSLNYRSAVYTDDDSSDILSNRLVFVFSQELTEYDGLRLNLNVSSADNIESGRSKYKQAGASISYFKDINRDLSFVTGYRHSYYDGDQVDDTVTRNEIFARFDKRFSLRP